VPKEGVKLGGLLAFLEEDFDIPSATIVFAHADLAPVRFVSDENHQALLSVDFKRARDASDEPVANTSDQINRG
jgi:hypothetical protein